MKKKQLIVALILVMSILLYTAPDHPTHLHNGWLFNKMLSSGEFHLYDPYTLNGNQFLWSYGIPSNFITGLLWFIFAELSVRVAELIIFSFFIYYSRRIIKDETKLIAWWLITYFIIVLTGGYAYLLSYTLFFIAFTKKGRANFILKILASINHVYFSLINLLFTPRRKRKFWTTQIIILIVQALMTLILKISGGEAGIMILGVFWFRMLAISYPYVFTDLIKLKPGLRRVRNPGRINKAYKGGLAFGVALCLILFPSMMNTEIDEYKFNLPIVTDNNETARLVDINIIGVYQLPMQGMVLSTSQYFHEQENLIFNKTKYLNMLKKFNISYVIYCKDCIISNISYEKKFLDEEFKVVYSDDKYLVYHTKSE